MAIFFHNVVLKSRLYRTCCPLNFINIIFKNITLVTSQPLLQTQCDLQRTLCGVRDPRLGTTVLWSGKIFNCSISKRLPSLNFAECKQIARLKTALQMQYKEVAGSCRAYFCC